ncbi:MAG: hypothetical protein KGR16_05085 [Verrucomicrobia bacterium]|nr:hypothetical protein [Verrucomicrobiota bacterium]MDE3046867.1 hypothetical protein [Verrucomicrobiota bacterium]
MMALQALDWYGLRKQPDRIRDLIQASNVEVTWAESPRRGGYWHTLEIFSYRQYIGGVSVLWDRSKIVTEQVDPRFEPMREFFRQLLQRTDSSMEAYRLFEWYKHYPPPVVMPPRAPRTA